MVSEFKRFRASYASGSGFATPSLVLVQNNGNSRHSTQQHNKTPDDSGQKKRVQEEQEAFYRGFKAGKTGKNV